jgi:hypothetical protein
LDVTEPTSSSLGFNGNSQIDHYFDTHGDPSANGLTLDTAYRFEDVTFTCSLVFNHITRYVIIENCRFEEADIFIWQSRHIFVDSSSLLDSEIEIKYSESITITTNSFEFGSSGSGTCAVEIVYSESVDVIDNEILDASRGIKISGSEYVNVENNDLTCKGPAIIQLDCSTHVSVYNNIILGNDDAGNGIYLSNSDYNDIILNHVSHNVVGINISSTSTDNVVAINWLIDNQQQIRCNQADNSWRIPGIELGNVYSDYMSSHSGATFTRVDQSFPEYFNPDDYQDKAIFRGSAYNVIDVGINDEYPLVQLCNVGIDFSVDLLDAKYLRGVDAPTVVITHDMPVIGFIGAVSISLNGIDQGPVDLGTISGTEIHVPVSATAWQTFGSGSIVIEVTIETIFGAVTQQAITIEKDISAPVISIISPLPNKWYGHTAIAYELDITEPHLEHVWYSVDAGITKYDLVSTSGSLDQGVWGAFPHGQVDVMFGAEDTLGNAAFSSISVYKDMTGPNVIISSPQAFQVFSASAPQISLVISDPSAISSLSYSVNIEVVALDPATTTFTLGQTVWNGLADGYVEIEIYAVDEWGNDGTESIVIKKDTVKPIIQLTNPANFTYFGNEAPCVSINFADDNFDFASYTIGTFPQSFSFGNFLWIAQLDQAAWSAQPDGLVSVGIQAHDKAGNVAELELILGKDTVAPSIEIFMNKADLLYGQDIPSFRLSVTDPFLVLSSLKYSLDGGASLFSIFNLLDTSVNTYYWAGLPTGNYDLTVYAEDAFGNQASSTVVLEKDVTAPSLTIEAPLEDSVWGFDAPTYEVTASDPHYAKMQYSLDGGKTRYDANGLSGTIDTSGWFNVPKGENHIIFYALDTLGNEFSTSVRIYRDEAPPLITINSPVQGMLFGNASVAYSITIIDDFLSEYWYTIGESPTEHQLSATTGTIDLGIWESLPDGPLVLRFYAEDTLGNLASNATSIIKDTTIPGLTFSTETDLFGVAPMRFDLDIVEPHLGTLYYKIDDESEMHALISGKNEVPNSYWQLFTSGSHTLTILVSDSLGNTATVSYDFMKDTVLPSVTCISPSTDAQFGHTVPMIDFEIEDMSDIVVVWYALEGSSAQYPILLTESFVALDETFWASLPSGMWCIVIRARDTAGNVGSDSITINKDVDGPIINFLYPDASFVVSRGIPPIIFTVDDINLNHVWYWITGSNGYQFRCKPSEYNGSIDAGAWSRAFESEGKITLRIFAEDDFGSQSEYSIAFDCAEECDFRVGLSNFVFKNAESSMIVLALLAIVACIAIVSKKRRIQKLQNQIRGLTRQANHGNEIPVNIPAGNHHIKNAIKILSVAMLALAAAFLMHQCYNPGRYFELTIIMNQGGLVVILVAILMTMLVTAMFYSQTQKVGRRI